MPYKNETEVRAHAEQFAILLAQNGMASSVVVNSFRDFTCKIAVGQSGNINIYYSPNKDSFTVTMRELRDASVAPRIEQLHRQFLTMPAQSLTEVTRTEGCEIYVDGSYDGEHTGYGVVILQDGQILAELSGETPYSESHQVGGEIAAVMEAVKWCAAHDITTVTIHYDFENLEKWATGVYQAQADLSQSYVATLKAANIRITWHKVQSHTGVR